MTPDQLEYLVAAVEYGSFAEAARHLHVTPQAIARIVKKTERQLGVELFSRVGRSVVPTSVGRAAAEAAQRVLEDYQQLQSLAQKP